jgi:hypothetical protein
MTVASDSLVNELYSNHIRGHLIISVVGIVEASITITTQQLDWIGLMLLI